MSKRRPNVIRRIRVNDPREQMDDLSDGEGMARFLLRNGYRSAMDTATSQYKRATDNSVKAMWHNAKLWVGMLSDKGGVK